jgi:phosphoribosylaminoimidazole carboxylase PurE protein
MRVLAVFGSGSDEPVYAPLCAALRTEPVICSAHRDPERLRTLIQQTDADVIITGAGLAAHLPGVVASLTTKPVIGLPISAALGGLDSLFSIMQMPPGIPVICSGVNATDSIVRFLRGCEGKSGIRLVGHPECGQAMAKAEDMLHRFKYPVGNFPIRLMPWQKAEPGDGINVLCGDIPPEQGHELLRITQKGMFVGLNRGENAVLAAIALLERGAFAPLEAYRQDLRSG